MLAAEVDNSQVPETKQNKNVFLAHITTSEDVGGGVTCSMQSFEDVGLALLCVSRALSILLADEAGAKVTCGRFSRVRPGRDTELLVHVPLARTLWTQLTARRLEV